MRDYVLVFKSGVEVGAMNFPDRKSLCSALRTGREFADTAHSKAKPMREILCIYLHNSFKQKTKRTEVLTMADIELKPCPFCGCKNGW